MANKSSSSSSSGIGFFGLLAIVFIVLKLTKFIDWSWWWVLSPIWGAMVLGMLIVGIYVIIAIIVEVCKG